MFRPLFWVLVGVTPFLSGPLCAQGIRTAPGFHAELLYRVPRESAGSWVALCVDPRGRLLVSDQYGPLHRVTPPPIGRSDGTRVERLTLDLGSAQGLAFVGETLFATVAEKVHGGPGLFRARDTNGDGDLDEVALLKPLDGTGEHGPHAVIPAPDGKSLLVIGGNATRLPTLAREAARPAWSDASLLTPVPALIGSETRGIPPGGWICRTDLDGREWTLLTTGFRNHYDAAFNREGELFTFDSDTEFDVNLPWYRPTRVLHAVSGADFGWRPGASKIPEDSPETLPPVIPLGLSSPTGVTFGYGAKFPARYAEALFVADWSFGRIHAVHLGPAGATYRAEPEEIVIGAPLPITDLVINPHDGALYFLTGGRRMHAALYRLTWTGPLPATSAPGHDNVAAQARAQRHALERFHGVRDPAAVAAAWLHLGSADRFLRGAALRALESQPAAAWRGRALAEQDPRTALAALLALARSDPPNMAEILAPLRRFPLGSLADDLALEKLRLLGRCLAQSKPADAERAALLRECDAAFPARDARLSLALGGLLAFLEAPRLIERTLAAIDAAPTHEEQISHATTLRTVRGGWTPETRALYFRWFDRAAAFRGGSAFRPTLDRIRADALANVPTEARAALSAPVSAPPTPASPSPFATRTATHAWTVAELTPAIETALRAPRDASRGRAIFGAAGCFACHAVGGEGGALGPDLSGTASRLALRDLLEAIVEPSRSISDQYGTVIVTLSDGAQRQGRLVNQNEKQVHLSANLLDPTDVMKIDRERITRIEPSFLSLMPPGLLDGFRPDEIADLVAFLFQRRP